MDYEKAEKEVVKSRETCCPFTYKDKNLKPLTILEWGALFEDAEYRQIACDTRDNIMVSTIWFGHQLDFFTDNLIFESMVFKNFDKSPPIVIDMQRYTSLAMADEGHKRLVDMWINM